MKKNYLEKFSSLTLFVAKGPLYYGHISGWWLTILGDGAFALLAFHDKLYISFVSQLGAIALCAYGIIKWSQDISLGLTSIDYAIMIATLLVSGYLAKKQLKKGSDDKYLLLLEILGAFFAMTSYYLLAIAHSWSINRISGVTIAWSGIFLCHISYCLIGKRKKYAFFATLQAASCFVALTKLFYSLLWHNMLLTTACFFYTKICPK